MSLPELAVQAAAAGSDGAVVSVWDGHRLRPLAASGQWALAVADAEVVAGHGPATTAIAEDRPLSVQELAAHDWWPGFTEQAQLDGVRAIDVRLIGHSVFANPLGALSLYRRRPGPLPPRAAVSVEHLAQLITRELLDAPLADVLTAVAADDTVNIAAGMLSEQWSSTPQHALALLRAHAFTTARTLHAVASEVVASRGRHTPPPP